LIKANALKNEVFWGRKSEEVKKGGEVMKVYPGELRAVRGGKDVKEK